jgi:HD domain
MAIQSPETIADIAVPDTPLGRDSTDFIRDTEGDLLFDHSRRVFLFGALHGRRRGLQPDPELLYAEAMFHDLGLRERYHTSTLRFEVDGATAAREFLFAAWRPQSRRRQGVAEHRPAQHTGHPRVPRPKSLW